MGARTVSLCAHMAASLYILYHRLRDKALPEQHPVTSKHMASVIDLYKFKPQWEAIRDGLGGAVQFGESSSDDSDEDEESEDIDDESESATSSDSSESVVSDSVDATDLESDFDEAPMELAVLHSLSDPELDLDLDADVAESAVEDSDDEHDQSGEEEKMCETELEENEVVPRYGAELERLRAKDRAGMPSISIAEANGQSPSPPDHSSHRRSAFAESLFSGMGLDDHAFIAESGDEIESVVPENSNDDVQEEAQNEDEAQNDEHNGDEVASVNEVSAHRMIQRREFEGRNGMLVFDDVVDNYSEEEGNGDDNMIPHRRSSRDGVRV